MHPITESVVEITMLFDYLIVTGEIDRDVWEYNDIDKFAMRKFVEAEYV